MATYYHEVHKLEDKFDGLELNHILRRLNEAADTLAKIASNREPIPTGIFASNQYEPSVHLKKPEWVSDEPLVLDVGANQPPTPTAFVVVEINEDPKATPDPLADWRTPYLDCLICEALSADKTKARWLARCAKSFIVIGEELYKKSNTGVLQRSIPTEQGKRMLDNIHRGACGHHAGPRTLVGKAF
jgi:hypothetical protein